MGARMLRSFVEQPLIDRAEIEARYDAVGELNINAITREEIREYLNPVYDLERLVTRVTLSDSKSEGSDLAFKNSIAYASADHVHWSVISPHRNCKMLYENLDTLDDIFALIDAAIDEEPPHHRPGRRHFKRGL